MNGLTAAFTGRLGGDPEMRYSGNGKALLNFSVAVDANYTANEDRAAPETQWVRVTVWGEQAETLAEQLHKGSSVYCEGRLKLDRWTGPDGAPRAGLSISAWRCDVHGQIGKNAPRREREEVGAHAAW